jgi:chromosomal replication initiation ATPase DnaA
MNTFSCPFCGKVTVGKVFGRDHTTVLYARDKISELMEMDRKLATEISDIKKMILKQ